MWFCHHASHLCRSTKAFKQPTLFTTQPLSRPQQISKLNEPFGNRTTPTEKPNTCHNSGIFYCPPVEFFAIKFSLSIKCYFLKWADGLLTIFLILGGRNDHIWNRACLVLFCHVSVHKLTPSYPNTNPADRLAVADPRVHRPTQNNLSVKKNYEAQTMLH